MKTPWSHSISFEIKSCLYITHVLGVVYIPLNHVENAVLDACTLCHLPMYTVHSSVCRRVGEVEHKVPNVAPEIILILEPAVAIREVRIRVKEANAIEVWGAFDDR